MPAPPGQGRPDAHSAQGATPSLVRRVIRQFPGSREDGREKTVVYVDPRLNAAGMWAKLGTVFPPLVDFDVPRLVPYCGTFVDFSADYLALADPQELGAY